MLKVSRNIGTEAGYHQFTDDDGEPWGSFEIFWNSGDSDREIDEESYPYEDGWYWVAGFPGCLWDGEPNGPFSDSVAARFDADPNWKCLMAK